LFYLLSFLLSFVCVLMQASTSQHSSLRVSKAPMPA
jgi:hypothetical protein